MIYWNEEARATLYDTLVYHQLTQTPACICGWAELGKSHPEHVIRVFEDALSERSDVIFSIGRNIKDG